MKTHVFIISMFLFAGVPTVWGDLLLDYGQSSSEYIHLSVKGSNITEGGATLFQAFTIDDPAWQIETIGITGMYYPLSDEGGLIGTIVPDLNSRPEEDNLLASTSFSLPTFDDVYHNGKRWVDSPIDIVLQEGNYWLILSAPNPDTHAMMHRSSIPGGETFTRHGNDGTEIFHALTISFRVFGDTIPEPTTIALLGLGSVLLLRRRR